MSGRAYIVLLIILTFGGFICGFTYEDVKSGSDVSSLAAALKDLPARLQASLDVGILPTKADLECTDTYWSVCSYVGSAYYGNTPSYKELTYAAIRGMLASLGDRYTRFLDPKQNQKMQEENRGDFQGIGAELKPKDGRILIKRPIPGTPAMRAGLKAGDVILKVDDTLVQGMDIQDVVGLIRGEKGTKVRLTVKREGVPDLLEFEIIRDVVESPTVEPEMKDHESKIGWIAIRQFNEKADQQFDKALTELESENLRGLILDLRGNPGGLLDVAVDIGSRFIEKGDIVIIQNKGGERTPLRVKPRQHNHQRYPLVVLVDEQSASASEIIAGAIQDHKAGILVGTDTFGKGLVQQIFSLEDGSAVAITTAKYFTPLGRDVDKNKIHPDVVVVPTEEDLRNENDVQLKKAIEILKERLGPVHANLKESPQKKG